VGPFGNTAEGSAEDVLRVVDRVLRDSLDAGATRISLQLNVLDETAGDCGDAGDSADAGDAGDRT
jgi:uncharacterized protein YqgV (UPF0045/DUF77 family)